MRKTRENKKIQNIAEVIERILRVDAVIINGKAYEVRERLNKRIELLSKNGVNFDYNDHDFEISKVCKSCGESLKLSAYTDRETGVLGLNQACKECDQKARHEEKKAQQISIKDIKEEPKLYTEAEVLELLKNIGAIVK